ncbi:uncharacterized protein LOC107013735 [Solanum pennellii]|uniref:Uncharacterized protein LOC107013735 n=1 Tax=Solanum pennellii TaxID=28526 RepID=A0ABM1GCA6_SOLPN|nr:uncharacterized protein LOC107013735 [Solanum pennellii]
MAIDMISDPPSLATSPRISFSHNLSPSNLTNILQKTQIQEPIHSNSEFDFCISNAETSSADELFSDGLIRPIQLQEKFVNSSKQTILSKKAQSLPPLPQNDQNDQNPKQEIKTEQQKSHSFWGIKRSSSVHCVNTHKKSSSFWSLPLLSRSNSTGSVPNSKKQGTLQLKQIKNSSTPASFYTFPSAQKPPLRKNYGAAGSNYGNGIRISPVLNVASQNLFGFGSLFRNGKRKKSKK